MQKQNNIPQLRFPEFKGEWEKKQLGDISEKINSGKTPLGGESVYTEKGILFIRSQNVTGDKLSYENSTFISEEINNTMKNSVVKPKDILLNITGASLGRSCVVPEDFVTGNVNQHVCIIRIDKNNDPYFIQPILSSEKGQNLFTSLQTGSGREGLNFQSIRKIELYFPSLPEQKRIASFFSVIDKKIEELREKKNLLKHYKKGVMQKLSSLDLRFKDDNGNDFPNWEEKKLRDLVEFRNGKAHEQDISENGKYIVVNSKFISRDGEVKKYSDTQICPLEFEEIVMVMSDIPNGKALAKCFLIDANDKYTLNQRICALKAKTVEANFLIYLLNRNRYYLMFDSGVGQTNLTRDEVLDCPLFIPPSREEQIKIYKLLLSIDKKIRGTNLQISRTEQYKNGLLQKMFC